MTIGERIKNVRKEKKISVDYIASALGVSKTTIYRYEDSTIEKIPLQTFDRLCEIFGVTAAELMGSVPSGFAPSGSAPSGSAPSGFAPSGSAPSGFAPSGSAPSGSAPCGYSSSGFTVTAEQPVLPSHFDNAVDAMEFMLKTPTLAAFGGYDPSTMSDEVIVEFANEILQQLKLVSYKYKK